MHMPALMPPCGRRSALQPTARRRAATAHLSCRRLGALSGIAATVTFPPLHRCLGLVATGALSVWLQLACLLGGVAPAVAAAAGVAVPARARMLALVWGLVLSRFGLWSFDLAANQLVQETAEHAALGTVSGVQGSLQALFQARGACRLACACVRCACAGALPAGLLSLD